MPCRTIEADNGQTLTVYRQWERSSSKTEGHAETIKRELEKIAASGNDFQHATVQRSWTTATGGQVRSRRMPDIIAVDKEGKVHVWEVLSKTDNYEEVEKRVKEVMNTLPEQIRGGIHIIRP